MRARRREPELRQVALMGALGRRFGRHHKFTISSPAEAVRALCANFPGFEKELRVSVSKNIGYRVIVGKTPLEHEDELRNPSGRQTVKIVPVLVGSGGVGKILLGTVLIGAAIIAAPFTAGTSLAFIPSTLAALGISFALGGVAQLLAKNREADKPKEEQTPNYAFSGPVNLTAQGHPVPIGYGKMIVGSTVVSAGIDVFEEVLDT